MSRLSTFLFGTFVLLYAVALFIFATGTFGWFGQERDPLSGVFLLPLGLPWVLFTDFFPEAMRAWFAVLAPMINIAVLWRLSRAATKSGRR